MTENGYDITALALYDDYEKVKQEQQVIYRKSEVMCNVTHLNSFQKRNANWGGLL